MKKLLYVCEADSGGIMEYAILLRAARLRRDESAYLRWRGYGVTCGNW